MHLFYTLWDYLDDAVFGKPHPSDCQELQRNLGLPAEAWLALIFLFEALVFMAAILAGICVFKVGQRWTELTPENARGDVRRRVSWGLPTIADTSAGFLPT
jgi:hypothetical protein